jgi:hypothetical protein
MKNVQQLKSVRSVSWFLLLTFLWGTFYPTVTFAGGGGPTQPEVHGFTPIGVSDMVDPFTGDFSYNIPLMDVEGYPINIAYASGASMDQEASWVGLGWSLNTGAIVRNMRGLPDDFNGDLVEKTVSQKPNVNISADAGATFELFGKKSDGLLNSGVDLKVGVGASYSNYTGVGANLSFGPSFNIAKFCGGQLTGGFSISGSSENGAGFSPNLSFSNSAAKSAGADVSRKTTVGAAFNSRAGLQQISYSSSLSKQGEKQASKDVSKNIKMNSSSGGFSSSISGSYNLGLNSYSPQAGPSMLGFTLSGSVSASGSFYGVDAQGNIGITYSQQWIPGFLQTIKSPAYGYFNGQFGENNLNALLDFNRDNDGSFTKYHRDLPSAFQTYDLFSIQAQGVGGSFRGYRNDVGYVFDAQSISSTQTGDIGIELGVGGLLDFGVDLTYNSTYSYSGLWDYKNDVIDNLKTQTTTSGNIVPPFSMIDASEASVETSPLVPNSFLNTSPAQFDIEDKNPRKAHLTENLKLGVDMSNNSSLIDNGNKRSYRIPTNKQLYFLSNMEVNGEMGVQEYNPLIYSGAKSHHIGEITQLGTDGRRYIFGLPAYNQFQEDVTFAIGDELYGNDGIDPDNDGDNSTDDFSGLVYIDETDFIDIASTSNKMGIDHYYSKTKTPAYAHSYMLTSILSDDYIDADAIQGPSEDDMGSYVKFDYDRVQDFAWRTPMQQDMAYYNEGMKTDQKDDKASYVYGKKELYYLKKVETKNYIAIFKTVPRLDGYSAASEKGGFDLNKSQEALESITLYSRADYFDVNGNINPNAVPLQKVEFKYSYKLCKNYPGNKGMADVEACFEGNQGGKLTLTDIYVTYQGSNKMKKRNYHFNYREDNIIYNPSYNLKATDRWGCYKPNSSGFDRTNNIEMTNGDWPYAIQEKSLADQYAAAWALTEIQLPSGGTIKVDYESDDYAFVQHLPAAKMFKIVAVQGDNDAIPTSIETGAVSKNISNTSGTLEKNKAIYFKFDNPSDDISDYVQNGQQLYFRCLMDFNKNLDETSRNKCEMVSGYATVESSSDTVISGVRVGKIQLKGENFTDSGPEQWSPITKAAILFGRMHLSRTINNAIELEEEPGGGAQALTDVANALVGSLASFGELITGPTKAIYNMNKGVDMVLNKSFIRLREPSGHKYGGGSRVKQIRMYDNWNTMTSNTASGFYYGQEFEYKLENGRSSGVASYEPQLGGDENPWHKAYEVNQKKRFAMDEKLFIEEPIMESQFPNPSIGYSRVVIKDIARAGVERTATGKVVKEFYTARDFPTIVNRSKIETRAKNSFLPLVPKYQFLVASQGFTIELNDMHGKPKKEEVYAQGKDEPISKVDYIYQTEGLYLDGYTNYKLKNDVKVINQNGQLSDAKIGERYDAVADFRESTTQSDGITIQVNSNSFLLGFIPIVVPTLWPKIESTTNTFRSATVNKTVNRFGILKETRANQDGSIVSTNNLAYDAQTGEVLATQTTTNFDDKVYSMNYPAYWEYPSFGQASKNVMYELEVAGITASGFIPISVSQNHFYEGDEVEIKDFDNSLYAGSYSLKKGWVVEKSGTGIKLIDKQGLPITGSYLKLKIIRSGYKNKQSTSMASLTALTDPTQALQNNNYKNVLNAGAVEFNDNWNTYCDCYQGVNASTNPFVLGIRGNWRPVRSYTHLSGRSQSNYNKNTNIRVDGVFTSYSPFYTNVGGNWNKNGANWTFVSEVTQFSPNGMTLETRDALGRYSASTFGFNNTLTTGVAANTKATQLAVGNFEDLAYTNCMDQGFFSKELNSTTILSTNISTTQSHTGRNSIKVAAGGSVKFGNSTTCPEENICNITATLAANAPNYNSGTITISGGSPNYQIELNTPLTAEAYQINGNQISYNFITIPASGPQPFITINVTDASGCSRVIEIRRLSRTIVNSSNYQLVIVQ